MKDIEMIFDALMHEAIQLKCTDIHFKPNENSLVFRRHKLNLKTVQFDELEAVYRHLKYRASIRIVSKTNAQSGVFQYYVTSNLYYLRFSILETLYQKHGVLRILNIVEIDSLQACGISKGDAQDILSMFNLPHGLVLFSGKTGAGKSTTMFACLNELKNKAVFSLENPIEKHYASIMQIETHASELNNHITQLLRHDPDILAIGEVRSEDDLESIIRASLSGHLICATIHAGSLDEVMLRLDNLKVIEFDLKSILRGIVFQTITFKQGGIHFDFEVKKFDS